MSLQFNSKYIKAITGNNSSISSKIHYPTATTTSQPIVTTYTYTTGAGRKEGVLTSVTTNSTYSNKIQGSSSSSSGGHHGGSSTKKSNTITNTSSSKISSPTLTTSSQQVATTSSQPVVTTYTYTTGAGRKEGVLTSTTSNLSNSTTSILTNGITSNKPASSTPLQLKNSYNQSTKVYISPTGEGYSTNNPPANAVIVGSNSLFDKNKVNTLTAEPLYTTNKKGKKISTQTGNELNSYNPETGVYTTKTGYGMSMSQPPTGAKIVYDTTFKQALGEVVSNRWYVKPVTDISKKVLKEQKKINEQNNLSEKQKKIANISVAATYYKPIMIGGSMAKEFGVTTWEGFIKPAAIKIYNLPKETTEKAMAQQQTEEKLFGKYEDMTKEDKKKLREYRIELEKEKWYRNIKVPLSSPYTQANLTLMGAEIVVPAGVVKAPKIVTDVKYKTSGTYINPENIFSKTALKQTETGTGPGLELSYNPQKTIRQFEKTKGSIPELPDLYTGIHASTTRDLGSKVLSREELAAKGITQGSEPGLFVSPLGAGQSGFTGIAKTEYKLTSNPIDIFNQPKPTAHLIGFEKITEYPESILKGKLDQKKLEQFQKSVASESTAIVTRMSSLGLKKEPEVVLSAGTPISEIKNPLYYTKIKGKIVPVKTEQAIKISNVSNGLKTKTFENFIYGTSKESKAFEDLFYNSKITEYVYVPKTPLFSSTSSILSKQNNNYYNTTQGYSINEEFAKYNKQQESKYNKKKEDVEVTSSDYMEKIMTYNTEGSIVKTQKSTTSGYRNIKRKPNNPDKLPPTIISSNIPPLPTTPPPPVISSTHTTPPPTTPPPPVTPSPIIDHIFNTKKTPVKGYKKFKFPNYKKQTKQLMPSYDVMVKKGNKWVNVSKGKKRNIYSALDYGSKLVDNTTARSFKVVKGTGNANIFKYELPSNINKFYKPSKTRNPQLTGAYVEYSKHAIDTFGEKKGLSIDKYLKQYKLKF
ncbi:hypothetical protein KBH77_01465 [Patescibacteria group bacterium]|nr:hypothetical protein [Patescibacteria group bacterium]